MKAQGTKQPLLEFVPQTGQATKDPVLRRLVRRHARNSVERAKGKQKVPPLLSFPLILPEQLGNGDESPDINTACQTIIGPTISESRQDCSPDTRALANPEQLMTVILPIISDDIDQVVDHSPNFDDKFEENGITRREPPIQQTIDTEIVELENNPFQARLVKRKFREACRNRK
jgi:hypothetical protein